MLAWHGMLSQAIFARFSEVGLEAQVHQLTRKYDLNRDGKVSYTEFMQARPPVGTRHSLLVQRNCSRPQLCPTNYS